MSHARPFQLICRELGLALAVLGLWMLVVLAPLHQSAGVLRERLFDGQNIQAAALILCGAGIEDADGGERPGLICPVQGIAKAALDLDDTTPAPRALALSGGERLWPALARASHGALHHHPKARGPPALI